MNGRSPLTLRGVPADGCRRGPPWTDRRPRTHCVPVAPCTPGTARCVARWTRRCPRRAGTASRSTPTAPWSAAWSPKRSSRCCARCGTIRDRGGGAVIDDLVSYLGNPRNRDVAVELLLVHIRLALVPLLLGLL